TREAHDRTHIQQTGVQDGGRPAPIPPTSPTRPTRPSPPPPPPRSRDGAARPDLRLRLRLGFRGRLGLRRRAFRFDDAERLVEALVGVEGGGFDPYGVIRWFHRRVLALGIACVPLLELRQNALERHVLRHAGEFLEPPPRPLVDGGVHPQL